MSARTLSVVFMILRWSAMRRQLFRGRRRLCKWRPGDRRGQRQREDAAPPRLAVMQPDAAAHRLHELAADIQAQPCPANLAGTRRIQSRESPEEPLPLALGDAHALIAHGES